MDWTIAAVTDLHFGPRVLFRGKLRKLSDLAPTLAAGVVRRLNEDLRPDLVLALGDLIEDESPEVDRQRYAECLSCLSKLQAPLRLVAGNHDTINQTEEEVAAAWQQVGPLHYSFDHCGHHIVVLRTVETRDVDVVLPEDQLHWLKNDLERTQLPTLVTMHHSVAEQDLSGNPWFELAPQLALVRNRSTVREVLAACGRVRMVLNGHLHWNHVSVHDGIPYVTVQSLTENVDDDAPGRVANALALIRMTDRSIQVRVEGAVPMRFEYASL